MHTKLLDLEYNAPPFEYLSDVLKRCPVKEQLIVRVKVGVFELWITIHSLVSLICRVGLNLILSIVACTASYLFLFKFCPCK